MKTAIVALFLVACGSTESTVTASSTAELKNDALNISATKLTAARKKALVNAYLALDSGELSSANEIAQHFTSDEVFAVVAVSDVLTNARMARPISIVVPAGTTSEARDPNRVDEFYVQYDPSQTEQMPKVFGPFPLLGQEGSTCAGFAGLRCADGFQCVIPTEANYPDAAGTCEAE